MSSCREGGSAQPSFLQYTKGADHLNEHKEVFWPLEAVGISVEMEF